MKHRFILFNFCLFLFLFISNSIAQIQNDIYSIRYKAIVNNNTNPPGYGSSADFTILYWRILSVGLCREGLVPLFINESLTHQPFSQ